MDKQPISTNSVLNDISFKILDAKPVRDKDSGEEISGLVKRAFSLTVPYRTLDERVMLARTGFIFGGRDFYYNWPAMTPEVATNLTEKYLKIHCKGFVSAKISAVTPAVYETPQPALKGVPLNAFEVQGTIYQTLEVRL